MNLMTFAKRHNFMTISLLLGAVILTACNPSEQSSQEQTTEAKVEVAKTSVPQAPTALQIAKKYLITDTHIDVPYRLQEEYEDVSQSTEHGNFDYPRAVAGGLDAPFMSIYIPSSLQVTGGSKELADKLIDGVDAMIQQSPDKFASGHSTLEVEAAFAKGLIALPMGMENGSPIEGDLVNLQHFYDRGIRYITLTHAKANHISDSSYDENRPAGGLTDFGKTLVVEMNKLGVMVDVSHISDDAFYQVMEITQVPPIASHSSARFFTPGFERNMSDEMIKLLASKGGVIQINFGSTFISEESIKNNNAYKAARAQFMQENNVEEESEAVEAFKKKYREHTPFRYATLNEVLDHFDHVVQLVGVDHVGIGSDFDGVGDSLPEDLKDVASYPNLIQGFLDRGYSESDIAKILSGNLMRVWKQNEVYAAKQKLLDSE